MATVGAWLTGDASTGAAYDVVLLAHVVAAIVALIAVLAAGVSAASLARPGPVPDWLVRYYRPGVNWTGRSLVLVPVLGFALVGMSKGEWSIGDRWVVTGLVLWVAAAALAEAVLWPTERRLQEAVRHTVTADPDAVPGATGVGATPLAERVPSSVSPTRSGEDRALCRRAVGTAAVVTAILVAAMVVMVAKP